MSKKLTYNDGLQIALDISLGRKPRIKGEEADRVRLRLVEELAEIKKKA